MSNIGRGSSRSTLETSYELGNKQLCESYIESRRLAKVSVIVECHLQNCQFSDINYPLSFGKLVI